MRRDTWHVWVAILLFPWLLSEPTYGAARESKRLPLLVHLAREQGQGVSENSFWQRPDHRANQIFAPYGLSFDLRGVVRVC